MDKKTYLGAQNRPALFELSPADNATELIVFVHGFMGFMDWGAWHLVRDFFNQSGYDFCRFNLSHNGTTIAQPSEFSDLEAFGQNTYSMEVADTLSLITELEATQQKWERIHLIGHSRGGATALLASQQWHFTTALGKVCTWAGICDIARRFPTADQLQEWEQTGTRFVKNGRTQQNLPQQYSLYTDFKDNQANLDVLAAASKLGKRLHIFHGDQDLSVPLAEAYELATAAGAEVTEIAGADHVFGAQHPWPKQDMPAQLRELCEKTLKRL
ncbi:MAG: alpha/beta hydrolase [Crocinitomicaceae bacterium]|nr:alpha/beta hydrolase [Crocinitomicaceae bacterium]MDP4955457.1 alpha/beta hydrolase [Crocinitomicaceae bacterium]MDP5043138.1 alpha/beta hydrolase [Crocinitomicaceae bacterium]